MPFVSTWTEELVAEWLQVEGYLVEVGLPTVRPAAGGRFEPDVVGAKVDDGKLTIRHCEVTAGISESPSAAQGRYKRKFSPQVCDAVERHFCECFGIPKQQVGAYEKWLIACYYSAKSAATLKGALPGLTVIGIDKFIADVVLPSLRQWQSRNRSPKGNVPALPRGLWLLQALDYMDSKGLLKKDSAATA